MVEWWGNGLKERWKIGMMKGGKAEAGRELGIRNDELALGPRLLDLRLLILVGPHDLAQKL